MGTLEIRYVMENLAMNIFHRYEGVRVGIKDMDGKFEVSEGLVV